MIIILILSYFVYTSLDRAGLELSHFKVHSLVQTLTCTLRTCSDQHQDYSVAESLRVYLSLSNPLTGGFRRSCHIHIIHTGQLSTPDSTPISKSIIGVSSRAPARITLCDAHASITHCQKPERKISFLCRLQVYRALLTVRLNTGTRCETPRDLMQHEPWKATHGPRRWSQTKPNLSPIRDVPNHNQGTIKESTKIK